MEKALELTKKEKEGKDETWEHDYPAPIIVREKFRSEKNPLLIIYPLNPEGSNIVDNNGSIIPGTEVYSKDDEPFIGFAISFPHTNTGEAVSYQVNTIADIASTEDSFDNENDVEYDRE